MRTGTYYTHYLMHVFKGKNSGFRVIFMIGKITSFTQAQGLAQVIVPAVATKLMAAIENLQTSASDFMQTPERVQTLHQFITSGRNISSLALETLAKDILKGEHSFHTHNL